MRNPNQPKNFDLKSALVGGGVALAIGIASYFGTNFALKNQQPQTLTQEQIDKNISFANKYPEIFNLAISAGAKIVHKKDSVEFRFENNNLPKGLIENLQKNQDSIKSTIGHQFINPNNLSEGDFPVVEIYQNKEEDKSLKQQEPKNPQSNPNKNSPL